MRERNLTVSGLMFASDRKSDILSQPFNDDRLRGFRLRVDGDFADPLLGINQINVTLSQGIHGLGSSDNGNPFASRAAGKVDFTKFEGQLSRLQPLGGGFSAFGVIYGQTTSSALLSPEQCGYGGRFFGRAYDPSELLADRCLLVNGELRYDIPLPATHPHPTGATLWFRRSRLVMDRLAAGRGVGFPTGGFRRHLPSRQLADIFVERSDDRQSGIRPARQHPILFRCGRKILTMDLKARNLFLATSALVSLGVTAAFANPLGNQVVGGSAVVQGQGTSIRDSTRCARAM
ncbi:MAG: ShlB/FhaC/HecB family hemolysin secretion/activation protein, partial [Hyphomicrobiales bacterium]